MDIIATWFDSTDLIDVRISHPCARTYVERAAREPGYTARLGEAAKRGIRAYQQMARDLGGQFLADSRSGATWFGGWALKATMASPTEAGRMRSGRPAPTRANSADRNWSVALADWTEGKDKTEAPGSPSHS